MSGRVLEIPKAFDWSKPIEPPARTTWGRWKYRKSDNVLHFGSYEIDLDRYTERDEILGIVLHIAARGGGMFTPEDVGNFVLAMRTIKRIYA